jgi:hypothetical protein
MPHHTRVRKVILRVSERSAPDTPAASPASVPPPPPSPSIPDNSQNNFAELARDAPPTYAPPYGMFYPPPQTPLPYGPYPQHQPPFPPYNAINGVPQPWGYTQYHAAPQQWSPFLPRPLAIEHPTAIDEDSHGHEARGREVRGREARGREARGHEARGLEARSRVVTGPVDLEHGTPAPSIEEERAYPNKATSPGGKCYISSHSKITY